MRKRWSGGLLAAGVASLLALQALFASFGLGMSAALPFRVAGFDICRATATDSVDAPSRNNDDPRKHQQCPFCIVAAQCASHPVMVGDGKVVPAFAVGDVASLHYAAVNHRAGLGRLRRTTGDPRGPPSFFV